MAIGTTRRQRVPGPKGHFLLGNTIDFQRAPLQFCLDVAKRYGDIVKFRVGFDDWYLVNNADYIHDITVKRHEVFKKPRLAKRLWRPFLGDGILTAEGDAWKRQHKLLKPGFHKQRIDSYGQTMVDYTEEMLSRWPEFGSIEMVQEMTALTVRIVGKTLFDAEVQDDALTIGRAMITLNECMVEHINKPLPVPRWWPSDTNRRKLAAIADVEGIVKRIIEQRRQEGVDRGDLLSMLVLARDDSGAPMEDRQLRDEVMTLIFAGHETTALALSWMTYLMAKHPAVVDRLRCNIGEVADRRPLRVSDLSELPYLEMVVKESMRILPSVWSFMRETAVDVVLGGYLIPKKSIVFISPYVTQHDGRYFDEPEAFRPERFDCGVEQEIPKGAYVPFAAGPRICLGRNFAMMEAKLILATLVRSVDFSVPEGYTPEFLAQLSLHPKGGLPLSIRRLGSGESQPDGCQAVG